MPLCYFCFASSGPIRCHEGTSTVGWAGLIYVVISLFSRIPLFNRRADFLPAKIISLRSSLAKSACLRFYFCIFVDRRLAMLTLCHFRSSLRRSRFHSVIDVAGKQNNSVHTPRSFLTEVSGRATAGLHPSVAALSDHNDRHDRDWIEQMN